MPIPAHLDLRRLGWRLLDHAPAAGISVSDMPVASLVLPLGEPAERLDVLYSIPAVQRRMVLTLGIDDPAERIGLLQQGFAEVLHSGCDLIELAIRAARVAEQARVLPCVITVGPLVLDLVRREGWGRGKALQLNPREFALLWHLARAPGVPVSQTELLREVWGLGFKPETNSLAVHISRVRTKLSLAGVDGLVRTTLHGAYQLGVAVAGPDLLASPAPPRHLVLDDYVRLGNEAPAGQEDADHETGIQSQ